MNPLLKVLISVLFPPAIVYFLYQWYSKSKAETIEKWQNQYGIENTNSILRRQLRLGMDQEMVLLS